MIKREMYMKRIRPFIGTELIKVMTGIRRCGKSVMLELIKEELLESGISSAQFISINFENLNFSHLQTAKSLHDEITKRAAEINGKVYLFFDEIQEVKDWEKCINSLRVSLDCDIYITGSNAKLLSGELSTYLGGRFVEFVIYPFSFAEFLELYRPIAPDEPIQKCFQKYLLSGGMPYLANIRYEDAPSKLYLHDLFNSVQLKDIVKRNKIRDVGTAGTHHRLCNCKCGYDLLRNFSGEVPQKREANRCTGDHPELHQILLRCIFVLSGQA